MNNETTNRYQDALYDIAECFAEPKCTKALAILQELVDEENIYIEEYKKKLRRKSMKINLLIALVLLEMICILVALWCLLA